ncbi:MAG: hypothetical protein ABR521_12265 [Gaiellaceae bacterium]
MPFALYEYDAAFSEFFRQAVHALARARSPLLSQIQFVDAGGTVGSRVRSREGMDVELEPGGVDMDVTADLKAVRAGDLSVLHVEMDEAAEQLAQGLVGLFVETMNKVTEGTGNVIDAAGQQLSFELIYEMLEKVEFSVNENNELVMPSLLIHPDQAEKLQKLEPLTPDEERRMAELKKRKREEALARRRRRRLS